jgi:hypothetical protein
MYEEKTFESYFNSELDRKSSIYFPPGQVQEGKLGFDAVSNTNNRGLWKRLGYPFWFFPKFAGINLREVADEMERYLSQQIENIPRIKANLLIQYKRPAFVRRSNGKEWGHWKKPYFRYDVTQSQQKLLAHLDNTFGSKALVIYAAPAVANIDDLVMLKKNNKIIENTNFCKSMLLQGHHRNTYVRAGLHSIACSDPVNVERLDLISELERMPSDVEIGSTKLIVEFSKQVQRVCFENTSVSAAFRILLDDSKSDYLNEHPLLSAYRSMEIFRDITGIQWLVATASDVTHN